MESIDQVVVNFNRDTAMLLNVSVGVIMFGVALELTLADFRRVFQQPRPILAGFISQFLLLPLLTFIMVVVIKPMPSIALGMFMIAACPGGNVSNFMSSWAKANVALSVSMSAIASTVAIFMTPLSFAFWSGLYEPVSDILKSVDVSIWEMIKTVFIIMAIPLFLGMLCRSKLPNFTAKIYKPMQWFSLLLFIGIVIGAVASNLGVLKEYISLVVLIVIVHNVLAILTGYSWAKLFRFSWQDVKSISIETGIQNSGLGLLLIFTFFDGLGGMALVAAGWGIWHLISGLSLAFYWRNR